MGQLRDDLIPLTISELTRDILIAAIEANAGGAGGIDKAAGQEIGAAYAALYEAIAATRTRE